MAAKPQTMQIAKERITKTGYTIDTNGCWIWEGTKLDNGYGQISIEGKRFSPHRLAWQFVNGEIPEGMFICHSCDVRSCINPEHLFLGSSDDNINDMISKNRNVKHESHGMARLTWSDVKAIRSRYQSDSTSEIAKDFNLEFGHVLRIGNNSAWHDPDYIPPSKSARLEIRKRVKLTLSIAKEIRLRYANGDTDLHKLAKEYGVTRDNIKAIVTGKTWNY